MNVHIYGELSFISDCTGSSLLHRLSLVGEIEGYSLDEVCRLLLVVASPESSTTGAQAHNLLAQYLWHTGLVALWHVELSQTRDQTHVPCIGRQILIHCITREV